MRGQQQARHQLRHEQDSYKKVMGGSLGEEGGEGKGTQSRRATIRRKAPPWPPNSIQEQGKGQQPSNCQKRRLKMEFQQPCYFEASPGLDRALKIARPDDGKPCQQPGQPSRFLSAVGGEQGLAEEGEENLAAKLHRVQLQPGRLPVEGTELQQHGRHCNLPGQQEEASATASQHHVRV